MTPEEIKAARERLAKLLTDMRTLNDAFKGRNFDAESKEKYERMEADFDSLNDEIKRAERLAGLTSEVNQTVRGAVRDSLGNENSNDDAEHKRSFLQMVRSRDGELALRNMNLGTNADGGYTVPTVLLRTVVAALTNANIMRQLGTVITTTSTTNIPLAGAKPTFALIAENGAYPETDAKFGIKTMGAYKVGGVIKASEELLNDSGIDIESYITNLMALGIAEFEEDKFINGTGSSDFTGIGAATVGKTTAAAAALTADEVIDMFYSIRAVYRPKASWVVGDGFEKAVRKLKDSNGNYLWQPSLTGGTPNTLLGRPVNVSANVSDLGTGNKIAYFGDMSYFQIADRGGMTMLRLNELYRGTGQIGFQVSKRGDSKIILDEAIKVMKNA